MEILFVYKTLNRKMFLSIVSLSFDGTMKCMIFLNVDDTIRKIVRLQNVESDC